MPWDGSYEELVTYLRRFIGFPEGSAEYDFNGIVHLLLAVLDNLNRNASAAEMQEIGESFNEEQAAFLLKLADALRRQSGSSTEAVQPPDKG